MTILESPTFPKYAHHKFKPGHNLTYLLNNQMSRFIRIFLSFLTILKAFLEPLECLTDIYILIEPVYKSVLLIPWPSTNGGSDKPALANTQIRQRLTISFGSYK